MAVMIKRSLSVHNTELSKNTASKGKLRKKNSIESIMKDFKKSREKSLNISNQYSSTCLKSAHKPSKPINSRGSPKQEPQGSVVDINERKIGNCLINNLYFIPKLQKTKGETARKRSRHLNMASLGTLKPHPLISSSSRKLKQSNFSHLFNVQRNSMQSDALYH